MRVKFNPERVEVVTGSSHWPQDDAYERYVLNNSDDQTGSSLDMSDGTTNSWWYRLKNSDCKKRRKR